MTLPKNRTTSQFLSQSFRKLFHGTPNERTEVLQSPAYKTLTSTTNLLKTTSNNNKIATPPPIPSSHKIYMDFQATTPIDPRVLDAMLPFQTSHFGNPHSRTHNFGWTTERAVEHARTQISDLLNCDPNEIIFTSGATEATNLALKGLCMWKNQEDPSILPHFITLQTEHKCVLDSLRNLENDGKAEVTYLGVGNDGRLDVDDLVRSIKDNTVCVSVMGINNEIGVAQDLESIGKVCSERNVVFHCDAAQSFGKVPVDVRKMGIGMMSVSGHKVYGPKGVGFLFINKKRGNNKATDINNKTTDISNKENQENDAHNNANNKMILTFNKGSKENDAHNNSNNKMIDTFNKGSKENDAHNNSNNKMIDTFNKGKDVDNNYENKMMDIFNKGSKEKDVHNNSNNKMIDTFNKGKDVDNNYENKMIDTFNKGKDVDNNYENKMMDIFNKGEDAHNNYKNKMMDASNKESKGKDAHNNSNNDETNNTIVSKAKNTISQWLNIPRPRIKPLINGGGQEKGLRSGTVPVHLVVGLGKAAEICKKEMVRDYIHVKNLSSKLNNYLKKNLNDVIKNGFEETNENKENVESEMQNIKWYPGCLNLSFSYVEGEGLMMALKDIALSSGSACTSASLEPSYTLRALGKDEDLAHSSIRFGFGRFSSKKDVEIVGRKVVEAVRKLREMSPLFEMVNDGIDLKSIEWSQ